MKKKIYQIISAILIITLIFSLYVKRARALYSFVRSVGTPTNNFGDGILTVGASGAAAGDLIVVGVVSAGTSGTLDDTAGNIYEQVDAIFSSPETSIYVSRLTNSLSPGDTITAYGLGNTYVSIAALEFTGGTGSELDVSNVATNGSSIDVPPTASITTTTANDIVIAVTSINQFSTTLDHNPPANYSAGANYTGINGPDFYMAYSIVPSAGTARAWDTNQWNKAGNVATVNVAIKLNPSTPEVSTIITPRLVLTTGRMIQTGGKFIIK